MTLVSQLVAVWYIMWSNIGKIEENKDNMEFLPSLNNSTQELAREVKNDAMYIYADCHSSMKGIFFGKYFSVLVFPVFADSFDPFGRPTIAADSDHCFHTCRPSIRPVFQNSVNRSTFK